MKVLRVVTLASATGRYGGPFDTAASQARLVGGLGEHSLLLLAGHLAHDAPVITSPHYDFIVRRVGRIGTGDGFTTCMSWKMLREIIRQVHKSQVVHVSFARELIPLTSAFVAILLRKPLVLQPHGMLTARTSHVHRIVDIVTRPIYRRATRVIALTAVEKGQLEKWSRSRREDIIDIIGNPLPYEVSRIPIAAKMRAVFIARLEARKCVDDFVEASRIAQSHQWNEQYEVVGPDQGDGDLVRKATESITNLSYRGAVSPSEIEGILAESGVFVLTSKNEPWGNVLVAALIKGIPVVVTRSAALAVEIEDNKLGIVVPDGEPEAVAQAVHRILSGNWRLPSEEMRAKKFSAERFNQGNIVKALTKTYSLSSTK